jgi:phosphotransacetylase
MDESAGSPVAPSKYPRIQESIRLILTSAATVKNFGVNTPFVAFKS